MLWKVMYGVTLKQLLPIKNNMLVATKTQIVTHVQYDSVILESVGTRHYLRINGESWQLSDSQLDALNKMVLNFSNPLTAAKFLMMLKKTKYKKITK